MLKTFLKDHFSKQHCFEFQVLVVYVIMNVEIMLNYQNTKIKENEYEEFLYFYKSKCGARNHLEFYFR